MRCAAILGNLLWLTKHVQEPSRRKDVSPISSHSSGALQSRFPMWAQGKHEAMDHVRRKLGFSHDATVAAGDSGESGINR